MKQGEPVQLADGRIGYYQGTKNGKAVVLVSSVEEFETKDVRPYSSEWKTKGKGGL